MTIQTSWQNLGRGPRAALAGAAVFLAVATAGTGYWLLAPDYQVLFSDLSPQDAAAMAAELDKLKTPYRLGEGGTSLLVDRDQVYKTRMKLMGKDLPMRGAVGFELFNNSDFGMTEFAQKINYQRALQGELTRTILSLSQVRDARVILVLPEQGLFRNAASKAKASITLSMKPGEVLRAEQVTGIQRLVSASVPGILTQDVTILDQNGLALSRNSGSEEGEPAGSGRLDLKKETENYLARKAGEVLERTFGAGRAMASVDVVLNVDRTQVTTEDLVVPPGRAGQAYTGVVVRERETLRDGAAPLEKATDTSGNGRAASSQREVEYAVGRRVEQIVSQPGSIRRLQAVAVVREPLDAVQQEQIRRLVAAAVGASLDRGDTVVVHTLALPATATVAPAAPQSAWPPLRPQPAAALPAWQQGELGKFALPLATALALLAAIGGLGWLLRRRAARNQVYVPAALTESERGAALAKVQAWLAVEQPVKVGDTQ